jgi:hypothetical protein
MNRGPAPGEPRAPLPDRSGPHGGLGRRARRAGILLLALLAGPARADEADLCLLAARDAAAVSGVPLSVLLAVTLTETGRGGRPWPWTVNVEGEGFWFETREEAVAFAEARHAAGVRSFDVGCFQLNHRWHGGSFVSIAQMFDPLAGASYAAGFLLQLRAETGDWSPAAGAYHSRTPEFASRYRARFDAHRAALQAAGADEGRLEGPLAIAGGSRLAAAPEAVRPRVNTFPLLQAGWRDAQGAAPEMPEGGEEEEAHGLGSLVPLDMGS